jgi:CRP-like cAMP-binding protein
MALFSDNSKRMATAKAAKDSILIVILSFSIKELTQTHPDLMDKIKEIIEQRMWNNKILESK